jgi:GWxTD domain-containing protein
MKAQLLVASLLGLACANAHAGARADSARPVPNAAADEMASAMAVYERHGLIVAPPPEAVVGRVGFLAGATVDSTVTVIALSFTHPPIDVTTVDLARDGAIVRRFTTAAMTRHPADETAVFQKTVTLAPGAYELAISGRAWPLVVPRLAPGSLATPIPAYAATPRASLESLVHVDARARSMAIVGRDTAIAVYLEAYGADRAPVTLSARCEGGDQPVWRDTAALERHGDLLSGVAIVPVARLGLGEATLTMTRGSDSAAAPLFVGFGARVSAVSFDQLLGVLRYFAPAERLDSLRSAPPARRPAAWAAFLARSARRGESGADALLDYVDRVREANERYRGETVPGWETDRGSAYVMLGEPDQVFIESRRFEIWLYTRYFGRLVFADDNGRWRLTPESRETLATLVSRARSRR